MSSITEFLQYNVLGFPVTRRIRHCYLDKVMHTTAYHRLKNDIEPRIFLAMIPIGFVHRTNTRGRSTKPWEHQIVNDSHQTYYHV